MSFEKAKDIWDMEGKVSKGLISEKWGRGKRGLEQTPLVPYLQVLLPAKFKEFTNSKWVKPDPF